MTRRRPLNLARIAATAGLVTVSLTAMPGCAVAAFFGFVLQNAEESGSSLEPASYEGLNDRSFAVIVAADRSIQADHPGLVARLTGRITNILVSNVDATGVVPPDRVLGFQYNTPSWVARSYSEIADEFECDRLIVVDLQEYRLHDPGNRYLWDGKAAASIAVIERESLVSDEFAYRSFIEVEFPDSGSLGPNQIPRPAVTTELSNRLATRVAWLFYDKDVPNAQTW